MKHVIIPAAGLGTRFLPITKTIPKEMLPLCNKPAIEFIIQECALSDISTIHCVINNTKESLKAYLSPNTIIHDTLKTLGKEKIIDTITELLQFISIDFITQPSPRGLGDAILMARNAVSHEDFFGVLLPDDLIFNDIVALKQLMAITEQHQGMVLAIQEVPLESTASYGIVAVKQQITDDLFAIEKLVEKPAPSESPSRWGIIGRYILSPTLFPILANMSSTQNSGEVQLTDAIDHLISTGHPVYAYRIKGVRYDIGTPSGWLAAVIGYAENNPVYAPILKRLRAHT